MRIGLSPSGSQLVNLKVEAAEKLRKSITSMKLTDALTKFDFLDFSTIHVNLEVMKAITKMKMLCRV